jgi:hypothetical protein
MSLFGWFSAIVFFALVYNGITAGWDNDHGYVGFVCLMLISTSVGYFIGIGAKSLQQYFL